MIQVIHDFNSVTNISKDNQSLDVYNNLNIAETIYKISELYPSEFILWCHKDLISCVNYEQINSFCYSNNELISYSVSNESFISNNIGYVEQSIYIKFSKDVKIATWQMSSDIGIAHSEIFIAVKDSIQPNKNFNFFLNSMAKVVMPLGVFCYSNPNLLKNKSECLLNKKIVSYSELFKFVSQHYRKVWLFVLFFCLVTKKRSFPLFAFLNSLFYKKIDNNKIKIIPFKSFNLEVDNHSDIDVLIPTIGRKVPLYNFLKNLSVQTILPKKVIIIEQNPLVNGESELDYLTNEIWPFQINHQLIYQLGACNARNLALKEITSNWVFLADDDIEIQSDFLENCLKNAKKYNNNVFSLSCLLKSETKQYLNLFQWGSFGSGASFLSTSAIKNLKFDMKYEFGFGEDSDFGMQIRNNGNDVLYLPSPEIIHLKAPMGGFRTKVNKKWDNEIIQPKPSPTVIVYKLTYDSEEQFYAYKLMYFLRNFKILSFNNPISKFRLMVKKWDKSVYWAQKLISEE